MFDRLSSFKSHPISKIQNLVQLHYIFYWQSNMSAYIINLLNKVKYFCDNIENIDHFNHD